MEDKKLKSLRKAFLRRWKNIENKTNEAKRLNLPERKSLWGKVLVRWKDGFKCEYCGRKMLIKDPNYPHRRSFSLDHRISVDLGGDNSVENFAVVCHRCNVVKGTLRAETFERLLEEDEALIDSPGFLDQVFSEMWNGRLAEKLDREEARGGQ